ncbi:HAMP domain-containing sensor histidine kinase [Okeania sp. KiyG1]|uniref:sensor histidine kinase n=1 Tax=Okeania sp. KiyG1 TaxID=2720165 RepID=UPI0019215B23|nr:HAMP domain-containing sensor histidine kinase [Okeania sp. KiyG1]GFZ99692.1 hypothetical protein CYANOKiyG1_11240 [Okeania sp. KiyG1]
MQLNNPNQFTEKTWEAISRTSEIAKTSQNQQIETEHLMKALLEQNGLATSLFNKAGVSTAKVQEYTDTFINRQPKVKNTPNNIYLGRSLDTLSDNAEKNRQKYKDEYISVEHFILAYLKDDRFGKNLYQEFQLDETKLKEIISQVRGNQKVTDKNPEDKYKALEKDHRDELAKYLEQLQEARLEVEKAKYFSSVFPHNMIRTLRTPLNGIIGYSDLLYEDAVEVGDEDFISALERIKLAGTHLLEMNWDILDISKIEAGQVILYLESLEVNKLVEDVVCTAKKFTAKNRNSFKLVLGENLGTMYADMTNVKCVLRKILDNAENFTKDGLITLSVERVSNQKLRNNQNQNAESLSNAQNYIVFQVSDTGIGMTQEQLKDIFEPLTTHCSYSSGLGLGLAICQGFCEIMGAKIDVESEYGEGSKFTVWFPERMNETLRFGNNDQDLKLDEFKLERTVFQVIGNQKVTDKNLECKYETSEIYSREELARYIKQFQEATIKAKAAKVSIFARLGLINEFRTPLINAIIREAEILNEKACEIGDNDFTIDLKELLEPINIGATYLLKTISDFSYIAQIETGQITLDLENIDVNQLIQDVVDRVKNITEKNKNTFKLILGENLGNMYADLPKVREVLMNLLDDVATSTKGDVITFSVERVNNQKLQGHQNRNVESLNNAQNYIVFQVSNTDIGIGMTEEKLQDIFKPYTYYILSELYKPGFTRTYDFSSSSDRLKICQGLCEMMGAKISLERKHESGKGYTFTVWFPERFKNLEFRI